MYVVLENRLSISSVLVSCWLPFAGLPSTTLVVILIVGARCHQDNVPGGVLNSGSVLPLDDYEIMHEASDVSCAAFGDFGWAETNNVADCKVLTVWREPASCVWFLVRRRSDTLEATDSLL